jgi:glycosyltransferase involved in cell wall biosynthesis
MNLLFLDSIERDVFGGMEEWIRLVASGLRRRGHRTAVASRAASALFERIAASDPEVELVPLEISGDFNPMTIAAINRHLEREKTDVVIVNFNKDLRLGGLAAKWSGNARVVWSVGLDITKDNLIHRFLTPRLMDGAIVPSAALKAQITRHGYIEPNLVEVIPIGIPDLAQPVVRKVSRGRLREKYGIPEDAVIAVTSGRLVDQKGHKYLVEATVELKKRIPLLKLLLCGSGPLEASLRQQARTLGLEDRFVFAGMLTDLTDELAGSDLMIHPSIEEPFGISILEGMRAGLPVVASRVGGIPEVLGAEYPYLVEAKRPKAIADAVAQLVDSPARSRELGDGLRRRFLDEFSEDRMLERIEGYFQRQVRTERQHG